MADGKAWVVIEIYDVTDEDGLRRYVQEVAAQLDSYGVKRVAAGAVADGSLDIYEGIGPGRILIHEWSSADAFKAWQDSADYAELLKLRRESCKMNVVIIPAP